MSTPTNNQVGMVVTPILDTNTATPAPRITSSEVGQEVTYIPVSDVAPAAPVALDATDANSSQFTANWDASVGATSYQLDVSTVSNFASFVTGFDDLDVANVTTFDVTGLDEDTDYYYRVRASNTAGTSDSSDTIMLHTDLSVGPGDPQFTFTLTAPLYYVQGPGTEGGGQNVQPTRPLTAGTHTIPLDLYGGPEFFMTLLIGYLDSVNAYNVDGDASSGSGGFLMIYEEDDAPNVWQCSAISAFPFGLIAQPTFHQMSPLALATNQIPMTALSAANVPAP